MGVTENYTYDPIYQLTQLQREFNIVNSGQLELVTVKQTPNSGTRNLNNTPAIRDYVN